MMKSRVPFLKYAEEYIPDVQLLFEEQYEPEMLAEIYDENVLLEGAISKHSLTEELLKQPLPYADRFRFFIDGSYRMVRMGYYLNVPVYAASVTSALLERNEERTLHEVGLRGNFLVILYPFEGVGCGSTQKAEEFKSYLLSLKRVADTEVVAISDSEIKEESSKVLSWLEEGKTVVVISDITRIGMTGKGEIDLKGSALTDEGKVRYRARSRVRVLMAVMEALQLRYAREVLEKNICLEDRSKSSWIMIDGVIDSRKKFYLSEVRENDKLNMFYKTVGFVKNIRKMPPGESNRQTLLTLKENEYTVTKGHETDVADMIDPLYHRQGGLNWMFIYTRFRYPFKLPGRAEVATSMGLVKLQHWMPPDWDASRALSWARQIMRLIVFEKYPLPTHSKRKWNEAVAVEETEKVAKGRLFSLRFLMNLHEVL